MATILAPRVFARLDRVRHHVHLRVDRIGAPDHNAIRHCHLTRIRACQLAGTRNIAGPRQRRADRRILLRIAFDVAQPIDSVALHKAHCTSIIIGPHRFGAMRSFRRQKRFSGHIERVVPRDTFEPFGTFWPNTALWIQQTIWVMGTFSVAGNFSADHAVGVGIRFGTMHPSDAVIAGQFHLERAG